VHVIITAVAFIAILGVLVLVHELGHFLTARLFGIRVEEFGLGFPPRLYPGPGRVKRLREEGKTVYSLNALPLGGFVRLAGENGVGTTEGGRAPSGALSLSGQTAQADDPGAFGNKPAWQRAIVLAAGAFNNMVLAILLVFFFFAVIGTPRTDTEVTKVAIGSPAWNAGIRPGDVIKRVDGQQLQGLDDVHNAISAHIGQVVAVALGRRGDQLTVHLTPRSPQETPADQGAMGVVTAPINERYVPAPLGQAASAAINIPVATIQGIAALGSHPTQLPPPPQTSVYVTFGGQRLREIDLPPGMIPGSIQPDPCASPDSSGGGLTGPIGIIRLVDCEANNIGTVGWTPLLSLVIDLSASLAIINLLPFPALDGGRLLFVLIAAVSRRRVRPETEALVHALGMAALLSLMVFISINDLSNWLHNRPTF